jgi:hypothetical protein
MQQLTSKADHVKCSKTENLVHLRQIKATGLEAQSVKMKKVCQTNCDPLHISPYLKEPRRPMLNKQQAET